MLYLMEDFANRVRALRDESGESQDRIAALLDVSRNAIGLWERGVSVPGLELAHELATVFGVSLDWLTGRSNERGSPEDLARWAQEARRRRSEHPDEYEAGRRFAEDLLDKLDEALVKVSEGR